MLCLIENHHNDQGWVKSFRYLKEFKKTIIDNNKQKFIELIEERDRNLFHLRGDKYSVERFLLYCEVGIEKFNLGVK
jgi:hypothetical protein